MTSSLDRMDAPQGDGFIRLREARNVEDVKRRDRIVRGIKKIRAGAVLDKNTYEYWNRLHPDEPQIDTTFEDQVIAWCDGLGPMPAHPDRRQ